MAELIVEKNLFEENKSWKQNLWLLPCILAAVFVGKGVAGAGLPILLLFVALPVAIGFLAMVFLHPRAGLISFIFYCFFMPYFVRHKPEVQFGLLIDGFLLLTWLGVLFHQSNRYRWRQLHNPLVWFTVIWFGLTVLEIANPTRPSIQGWLQEMRSSALYMLLTVPLAFFLFNRHKDLVVFLHILISLSVLGAVYGIKQLYIGVDSAEHAWLEAGAKVTHILFGKLRVFSYYTEAAQFGASQAQFTVVCLILAVGPHGFRKKALYTVATLLIFYGMMISGTRGAMGGLMGGGFLFLILSKQTKILIIGSIIGMGFIGMLKYTTIGNNNDQIRRMRTSMDPNDPSLQVRLANQKRLGEELQTKPFGTGVGTIGIWGTMYNRHISIAMIPPDSMYVKQWVMYGIVGFIGWFGFMLFLMGRSIAIVWKTRDPVLRSQLAALTCGSFASLVCSYGNEVMNLMPSSIIAYITWALIWMSPRWDTPIKKESDIPKESEPITAVA